LYFLDELDISVPQVRFYDASQVLICPTIGFELAAKLGLLLGAFKKKRNQDG